MTESLDVGQLAQMRRDGTAHIVLDIRETDEVAVCSLADSLCVPMQDVPRRLDTLPRDRPLIVLCHHGVRSAMVTGFLRHNGFDNAWNLAGGIDAWARQVDPDMPRY
ncbi:MAG TPA: rhodanese-like domain-containing protein [Vineibacter sp.]|nr:rhodanese-like domain-containing protein [Vineibacter sp.]